MHILRKQKAHFVSTRYAFRLSKKPFRFLSEQLFEKQSVVKKGVSLLQRLRREVRYHRYTLGYNRRIETKKRRIPKSGVRPVCSGYMFKALRAEAP